MPTSFRSSRSKRGSLLIVAMILATVIGVSLTSYLQLGRTSLNISNRALYNNAAMNLAENGLEEAMYAMNKTVEDDSYAWPSWANNGTGTTSGTWRKWTGYTFDQNATGMVRVYIADYKGTAPRIIARSTITLGGTRAAPVEKWIEVRLRKTSKFSSGLVAKNSVIFNGNNTTVDSWNSDPDGDPSTPAIPYSTDVRMDNGSVGSISVGVDAVWVQNADIWGFVSTGGTDPTGTVGTNGSILGSASTYDADTWSSSNVDPSRVSTDFSASFEAVEPPAGTYKAITAITTDRVLPDPADVALGLAATNRAVEDGKIVYYYSANHIQLAASEVFAVTGGYKVVLRLTDSSQAVRITGNAKISVDAATSSALALYTDGDITIAGNGVANGTDLDSSNTISDSEAGQPINFQIWGTKTTGTQSISVAGNGTFSGIIYAPQGDVTMNGNGSISGSVVANNITLTGNANFHYDESLANYDGGNPYRVARWKELTLLAERNVYTGNLSF
jgi:hypothetical protein